MTSIPPHAAKFIQSLNNHDVEGVVSCFADDGKYSDFGANHLNMEKPTIRTFLTKLWEGFPDIHFDTASFSGSGNFTVWEWMGNGTVAKANPNDQNSVVGQRRTYRGVSVTTWNGEGKIVDNHEYWAMKILT